jgi:hypothetical protein
MNYTPLQIIFLRAPQWAVDPRLSSVPSLLDLAAEKTGTIFGEQTSLAIALRVLHWFALEAQRGGNPGTGTNSGMGITGRLTSESEGQLSKSFGDGGSKASRWADLQTTSYGCELIELIRSCAVLPRTRAMDSTGVEESVLPGFFSNTFGL